MKSVIKYVILERLRLLLTFKAKKYESEKFLEACVILNLHMSTPCELYFELISYWMRVADSYGGDETSQRQVIVTKFCRRFSIDIVHACLL